MSTEHTLTTCCGVLVPYALEADTDASTVGQASPVAGVPLPSEDSAGRTPGLTLAASGAQTSTITLSIATQDAGNVGQATYRVKRTVSGVADAGWRGADLPNVLTGFSGVGWASSARQTHPHAVTLPDDTQIVVYAERPTVLDSFSIKTQVWSPSTETYASAVTVVSGLDSSHIPHPWLLVMPDPQNRNGDPVVLLGHWDADDANNAANINLYISRDGGVSWSAYARGVLDADITINTGVTFYSLGRVRCAMIGSQIVMFMHLTADTGGTIDERIYQYASASAGANFAVVGEILDGSSPVGSPDVCSVGNMAFVVYSISTSHAGSVVRNPFVRVTTSEYPAGSGDSAVISGTSITFANISVVALPNSIAGVYWTSVAGGVPRAQVMRLYDVGSDNVMSPGGSVFWDGASTSAEYVTQSAPTYYRGQVRIYCNMDSASSTYENKITRLDAGGLTTVTMPSTTKTYGPATGYGWGQTFIPTTLPSGYTGWTRTTTGGSDDVTTTIGRHRITTAASTRYYTRSVTLSATQQMISAWRIWQVSGGSSSARDLLVGLRWARAGIGFDVELRCSATQIRSFDVNGGATLSTASVDVAGGIDVLMALDGSGKVSIWYREIGGDEDRNFVELETQTTVTDDAGAGGTSGIYKYGSIISSTVTAEYLPYGQREITAYGADDWATAFANPTTLRGIPYGEGTYALAGVKLTATGGPTLAGDAWTVTPDADYAYRNVLPTRDEESTIQIQGGLRPSALEAASAWRSTALAGDLVFRFRGARNRFVQAALGVHVEGLNVATYPVYGYNEDSAAYDLIGTGNQGKSVRFTRTNANSPYLKCDNGATSTDEVFVYENELAGGYFAFPNGDIRPIIGNGQGRWSGDDDASLPYILLDPDSIDGGEDATGAGTIIFPRSTFWAYLLPTTKYSKFMIRWTTQAPYEGYIKANVIAIGQILPMVRTRDWGTIVSWSNPSSFTEVRSGLRFGVQDRIASRKTLTIPLIGVQEQAALLDSTTSGLDRRYFKMTSTVAMPVAGQLGDAPGLLTGAWQRLMGSRDPCVYVPRLARGTPDTGTLVGVEQVGHYSRITSEPRFTDRYGVETGSVYGAVYVGENVVFEGEL